MPGVAQGQRNASTRIPRRPENLNANNAGIRITPGIIHACFSMKSC